LLLHKPTLADFAAVAVTVLSAFVLDRVLLLPRMMLLLLVTGPPSVPDSTLAVLFYLASAFFGGIIGGAGAMAISRRLVQRSQPAVVAVLSAAVLIGYALLTIPMFSFATGIVSIFVDHLPAFFPVYLELCGALPGWLLGIYFCCGFAGQNEIGPLTKLLMAGLASIMVAAIYVSPDYVPANLPLVPETFHTVPQP
jgi:hypothetical protein